MGSRLPVKILLDESLLNWACLAVGLDHRWASTQDVIQFAENWLVTNPSEDSEAIILLAGGEGSPTEEIRGWLNKVAQDKEGISLVDEKQYQFQMKKWLFAHLVSLQQSQLPDEEKLDRLQTIYAEFEYPEDMAGCSKYGGSQFAVASGYVSATDAMPDPLQVMQMVVQRLKALLPKKNCGQNED